MDRSLIENNGCPEDYKAMPVQGNGRFCQLCLKHLTNLSGESIETIATQHYGNNKCVALLSDQLAFIKSIKDLKKVAIAASLFLGTTFYTVSYGQSIEEHVQHKDSCLVTGTLIRDDKQIMRNTNVYVYLETGDKVYETTTNDKGEFALNLPYNAKVSATNIKQLRHKKTRNRNKLRLGEVKYFIRRDLSPGFF